MTPHLYNGLSKLIVAIIAFSTSILGPMQLYGDNIDKSLKRDYFTRQLRSNFNNSIVSLRLSDSLLSVSDNHMDSMKWNIHKVLMYIRQSDAKRADSILSILETDRTSIPEKIKLDISDYRMRIDKALTDYAGAITAAQKILNMEKHDSLKYYDFKVYNRLHGIYRILDMPDKSDEYIHKAGRWLKEHPKGADPRTLTELECEYLGAKASAAVDKEDYVEALELSNKIISISDDPNIRHAAMLQIALIYQAQGELEIALHYLNDARKLNVTDSNRAAAVLTYANLLNIKGEYEAAISFIDSVSHSLEGFYPENNEYAIHIVAGSAYQQIGNYREASYHFAKALQLIDSLQVQTSFIRMDAAKKQLADRYAVSNFKHISSLAYSQLWIIAVMVAIIILTLWLLHRHRNESAKILHNLENKIFENLVKSTGIAQTLMGENRELKSVAKETTMAMLRLAQISDAFDSINGALKTSSLSNAEKLKEIRQITSELHGSGDIWEMYKALFLNIDRSFFDKLSLAHPDLTKAELRMCGYILLNMSTKEIAALTNRSIRTVETIKYNLRKKLNAEMPTEQYLRMFTE
ncbi:MAG: hypothetical protein HDS12_00135 [Bacteroides sp.]|nr:hypothetical protein [Bacteroides sp.]